MPLGITRANYKLPLEVLLKIFELTFQNADPGLSDCKKLHDIQTLRLVCKQYAHAGKILMFAHITIDARTGRNKHLYQALLDSQYDAGISTRECVRSVGWYHDSNRNHEWVVASIGDLDGLNVDLPNLHNLELQGGGRDCGPVGKTGKVTLVSSQWCNDRLMVKFVGYHLFTDALTMLTISDIVEVPLHIILASPSLHSLHLSKISIDYIFESPPSHDLQAGFNLIRLIVEGSEIPPMSLLSNLTNLRHATFDVGRYNPTGTPTPGTPFISHSQCYTPRPFPKLEWVSFEGELEYFHRVFGVEAASEAGIELFPELTSLELIDSPIWRARRPNPVGHTPEEEVLREECGAWAGDDVSKPTLGLRKLESLMIDQRLWCICNISLAMFKDPASIIRYLNVPHLDTLKSLVIYTPFLTLPECPLSSDPDVSATMASAEWAYHKFMSKLKHGFLLISSQKKHYPIPSRVASNLRDIVVRTQLGPVPKGVLSSSALRICPEFMQTPKAELTRCVADDREMRDIRLDIQICAVSECGTSTSGWVTLAT